VEGIT